MLTIPLAVEKVLYRLALQHAGQVTLARLFLELPLSLEETEEYADQVCNGYTVRKDEFGEFLAYEFLELQGQTPTAPCEGCPTCGEAAPPAPTVGGVPVRAPALCDRCYFRGKSLARHEPDESVVHKLTSFFKGEVEEDLRKVAATEHEIFYIGLHLGLDAFTHTRLSVQSRLPSAALKERLDRMGGRRYLHAGLSPDGDAVVYRFPGGLTYPEPHYDRFHERKVAGADGARQATGKGARGKASSSSSGVRALLGRISVKRTEPAPDPPEPPKPALKITIKDRRQR